MKNFDIPKTVLNYELCVNPANAELLTMYQYTCEDFGREKSQDEDGDEPLVLNLAKKPKLSNLMLTAKASTASTGESDSLPSLGGLGFESRNISGNSEQQIAAEAIRQNDVTETQNYSQSESDDETGGSDDEKSDEKADEKEEHE